MLSFEKNKILWQSLIWGGTWIIISFVLTYGLEQPERFIQRAIIQLIGIVIIIVINVQFLLPQLYFKKRTGTFVIAGVALFIGVVWILNSEIFPWSDWINFSEKPFSAQRENMRGRKSPFGIKWMRHIIPFFLAFLGSTLIEVTRSANRKEKTLIQAEKEKLETEIKFLKSQINPHFLFNALNNIYSLTVIKSDEAPDNLLRLSGMLRYMLYDSNDSKVPLKKEIDYLKNYINLAKLKDSRGLNISLDLDESRPDLLVAPLLFIPFIENAFKHSQIEDLKNGMIKIDLKTKENQLELVVKNSIPKSGFEKDKVGGIGLTNTKQRLNLLYPNKHTLNISEDGNTYSVYLKLDLE